MQLNIQSGATSKSYRLTDACDKPRLAVSGSYIPLTIKDTETGLQLYAKVNNQTYRAMHYESMSTSATYLTTAANSEGLSSVTALTRSSTSATLTRSSTSATLTRSSTSATLTRSSTSATLTRSSTSATLTRSSTSATLTRSSVSGYGTKTNETFFSVIKNFTSGYYYNGRIDKTSYNLTGIVSVTNWGTGNQASTWTVIETASGYYNYSTATRYQSRATGILTGTLTSNATFNGGVTNYSSTSYTENYYQLDLDIILRTGEMTRNNYQSYVYEYNTTCISSTVYADALNNKVTRKSINVTSDVRGLTSYTRYSGTTLFASTITTATLTRSSISGYGTRSSISGYGTRSSISGYGTRSSISGYATRSSISGYATRSSISGYDTCSSTSGYSGVSTSSSSTEGFV